MTKSDWLDLAVLERQKYNHLSELMDLTRQLGEAMDRERVAELNGGASPADENEALYVSNVSSARKLWERVVELDQRLNRRIAGEDSFYAKHP